MKSPGIRSVPCFRELQSWRRSHHRSAESCGGFGRSKSYHSCRKTNHTEMNRKILRCHGNAVMIFQTDTHYISFQKISTRSRSVLSRQTRGAASSALVLTPAESLHGHVEKKAIHPAKPIDEARFCFASLYSTKYFPSP